MLANAETAAPPGTRAAPSFGKSKSSLLVVFDRQRRHSLIWFLLAVAAWVGSTRLIDNLLLPAREV